MKSCGRSINNIGIVLVPFDDAADVPNIMRQAGDDKVRIVGRRRRLQECTALEDVVAGQRDEHRMLDVVVEGIAISDAFERQPSGKRNEFRQTRMRSSEPVLHIGGEERA